MTDSCELLGSLPSDYELCRCARRPMMYHSARLRAGEGQMRRFALTATACFLGIFAGSAASAGWAGDLIWQVENPFRFFKSPGPCAVHEAASNGVRGNAA